MKIAALISGGKDSLYAAYQASKNNDLKCLITLKSVNPESYMFHIPNIDLVKLQARAIDIPLIFKKTLGVKEEELKDLENAIKISIKRYKIKGLVSGAIESNYQKERIENICKKLNIKSITPLWHINKNSYIKSLIKKFSIIITGIAADSLSKEDLGKEFNLLFIKKIKQLEVSLIGEGGEFETLVLDCPLFRKKLEIEKAAIEMESEFCGSYIIKKARLI